MMPVRQERSCTDECRIANSAKADLSAGNCLFRPYLSLLEAPETRSALFGATGLFGPTRIVKYRGHSQPPDLVSPCGVAEGEARPITLKRAFCSSVNEL